ncbi:alpha/beta-hydrolase [Artomyces pyxidatus]|uniref:Alpha/beta-hydrolase n=1 Tax=Artomyces pyxidatus TaxID=48021 RepID=A0ACB8SRP8_9AGAM|nr:alpha/beta-hydrolase [Artomyces pyxidatus]
MASSKDHVLAGAPGECCMRTVQHIGVPRGIAEEIGGINTYISHSPEKQDKYDQIILFFPDVFGPFYINTQLVADYFAGKGYLVVVVDYLEGDPIQANMGKPGFELFHWAGPKRDRAYELVPKWIEAVKARYGKSTTKYAALGYCFGGPDVLECATSDWISAAAIAHPAFLNEEHFTTVKRPLFLSCAEIDITFPRDARHRAEEILVEQKAEYHFQLFSGVRHGFGCRADPEVPRDKWAKEQSALAILSWFDRFCR